MKRATVLMLCTALLLAGTVAGTASASDDHGGDIWYTEPVMGVLFSHDLHVNDAGLDCESCHDDLFEMDQVAQKQSDFVMESLYQGMYCGACHDGGFAFASDTRCASCHLGVKGYNRAHGVASSAHGSH